MTETGNIDTTRLKSFIDRIEFVVERKEALQADLKELFAEAKSAGFEIPPLKAVLKLKKISNNQKLKNKFDEEQYWLEVYSNSLGIGG